MACLAVLAACQPSAPKVVGYVEGEFALLAPIEVSQIREVMVRRGQKVQAGAIIARMETVDAQNAVDEAAGRLAQAESELANLRRGRRPEEIEVLEASLASAEAQARDSDRVLSRRQDLFKRGFSSQAELDQAATAHDVAAARVRELKANLTVARLPARDDEIRAAENRVKQANAALETARWRLSRRTVTASADGAVQDIIRRAGEVAGPTSPVVSLLPEGALKLKFYVPEALLSSLKVGRSIPVACNGCPQGLTARVSYISPEPEFTPPVIYSVESRQKLVHLVEAIPESGQSALKPGQIVDVRLTENGS